MQITIPLREIRILKKITALSVAVVHLYVSTVGAVDFGRIMSEDQLKKDREQSEYLDPDKMMEQKKKRQDFIDKKNLIESEKGKKRDEDGKVQTSEKVAETIQENEQERKERTQKLQEEIIKARQKRHKITSSIYEFNYVKYDDGKVVRFKDGLISTIENERFRTSNGVVVIKNTTDMQYNEKDLLTSYKAEETDSQGNVTKTEWSGASYTDASRFYANEDTKAEKLVNSYTEKKTDALGNTTTVVWSDGKYEDKKLMSYKEMSADALGNTSKKEWTATSYEGDNVASFKELNTDIFGNNSTREWYDAKYIQNPLYKEGDPTHPKDLLISYKEKITDDRGMVSFAERSDIFYNKDEQIVSYKEKQIDAQGRESYKTWKNGTYNEHGDLVSYTDETVDHRNLLVTVHWHDGEYNKYHQLTNYIQDTKDGKGLITTVKWGGSRYNNLNQLTSFSEVSTDKLGNTSTKKQEKIGYDSFGRLNFYIQLDSDSLGNATSKEFKNVEYDKYNNMAKYVENRIDKLGLREQYAFYNGVYDNHNRLISSDEDTTDHFGKTANKKYTAIKFDEQQNTPAEYKEEHTDSKGNIEFYHYTGVKYDLYGNKLRYNEEKIDIFGNTTRKIWQGEYNRVDFLVLSKEYFTDMYGYEHYTFLNMSRADCYDKYGRLISYNEEYKDPDGNITNIIRNTGYNKYSQEIYSSEEVMDFSNNRTKKERSSKYNTDGLLSEYNEVHTDSNGWETKVYWRGLEYNDYKELSKSYQETLDSEGRKISQDSLFTYDQKGRSLTINQESVSTDNPDTKVSYIKEGISYDRYGQETDFEETNVISGKLEDGKEIYTKTHTKREQISVIDNSLKSYKQVKDTTGTDQYGQVINMQEITEVTGNTPKGYHMETHNLGSGIQDLVLPENWVYLQPEIRSEYLSGALEGLTLNLAGKDIKWEDLSNKDQLILVEGGSIDYEGVNVQLKDGNIVLSLDNHTKSDRSKQVYNKGNKLISYKDILWDEATWGGTTETETNMISYDTMGNVIGNHTVSRDTQNIYSDKVTKNISYNASGYRIYSTETEFLTGETFRDLPENWNDLTISAKLEYIRGLQLNVSGDMITIDDLSQDDRVDLLTGKGVKLQDGTQVKFNSDDCKILINVKTAKIKETSKNKYDILGRALYYESNVTDTTTEDKEYIKWYAGKLDKATNEVDFTKAYNALFQLSRDTTVTRKVGTDILGGDTDVTQSVYRDNMFYDAHARMLGYNSIILSTAKPALIIHKFVFGIKYDSVGRIADQIDLEHRFGEIIYDSILDYITDWDEVIDNPYDDEEYSVWAEEEKRCFLSNMVFILDDKRVVWEELEESVQNDILSDPEDYKLWYSYDVNFITIRDKSELDSDTGYLLGYTETKRECGIDYRQNTLDNIKTTERNGITYNDIGQMNSYHERLTSNITPDKETIKDTYGICYDKYGYQVSYIENARTFGETDDFLRLPDNWSEFDSEGNPIWSVDRKLEYLEKFGYNIDGRVVSWEYLAGNIKEFLTENIVVIQRNWDELSEESRLEYLTGVDYNRDGTSISWSDLDKSIQDYLLSGMSIHLVLEQKEQTIQSGTIHSAFGNVLAYHQLIWNSDAPGDVSDPSNWPTAKDNPNYTRVSMSNMTYNINGLLSGYHEIRKDVRDLTQDSWISDITYNELGQQITSNKKVYEFGFDDKGGEAYKIETLTQRSNTVYNQLGQMVFYRDKIKSSDVAFTKFVTWTNGGYNAFSQLQTFVNIDRKIGWGAYDNAVGEREFINHTVKTSRDYTYYNGFGQMTDYGEVIKDDATLDLTKYINVSSIIYDSFGRQSGFFRVENEKGMVDDIVTLDLVKKTLRFGAFYDRFGQVVGYDENIQTVGGNEEELIYPEDWANPEAYSDEERIEFLSGIQFIIDIGEWNRLKRSGASWQELKSLTRIYDELTEAQKLRVYDGSLVSILGLVNVTEDIHRYDTEYNNAGQLIHYKESRTSSDTPDLDIRVDWSTPTPYSGYNYLNQLKNYIQKTAREGVTYQELPLCEEWNDLTGSERVEYLVNRLDGIILVDPNTPDSIIDNWKGLSEARKHEYLLDFNSLSDSDKRKLAGSLIKKGGMVSYFHTEETEHRYNIDYNSFAQLKGYKAEITESQSPDLTKHIYKHDINYNSRGQMASFTEEERLDGRTVQTEYILPDKETWDTYTGDEKKDLLEGKNITKEGRIIRLETSGKEVEVDKLTVTLRKNMLYNGLGQVSSYEDAINYNGDNSFTEHISMTGMQYNRAGKLKNYKKTTNQMGEAVTVLDDGSKVSSQINRKITVNRISTLYNYSGLVLSYIDKRFDTRSADLATSVIRYNIMYSGFGLTSSYNEMKKEQGSGYQDLPVDWADEDIWNDEQRNNYLADTTVEVSYLGITNTYVWSELTETEKNINLNLEALGLADIRIKIDKDLTTKTSRTLIRYNDLGQESGYREIEETSDSPIVTVSDTFNMRYNGAGMISGYGKRTLKDGECANELIFPADWNDTEPNDPLKTIWTDDEKKTYMDNIKYIYDGTEYSFSDLNSELKAQLMNGDKSGFEIKFVINSDKVEYKTNMVYNSINELVGETSFSMENPNLHTTTINWGRTYNSVGDLVSFTRKVRNFGEATRDITDEDGNVVLDKDGKAVKEVIRVNDTKYINRKYTLYDENRNIAEYVEDEWSDAAESKVSRKTFKDALYDGLGRKINYTETKEDLILGEAKLPDNWNILGFDEKDKYLSGKNIFADYKYYDWDNLSSESKESLLSLLEGSKSIAFTDFEQEVLLETDTYKGLIYDKKDRLISYHLTKTTNASDVTEVINRSGYVYNPFDQAVSYKESQLRFGIDDIELPEAWSDMSGEDKADYLASRSLIGDGGRRVNWNELSAVGKEDFINGLSGKTKIEVYLSEEVSIERTNTMYNGLGNVSYYSEIINRNRASAITERVSRYNITYDGFGRTDGFHNKVNYSGEIQTAFSEYLDSSDNEEVLSYLYGQTIVLDFDIDGISDKEISDAGIVISGDRKYLIWQKPTNADNNIDEAKKAMQFEILEKLKISGLFSDGGKYSTCVNYTDSEIHSNITYTSKGHKKHETTKKNNSGSEELITLSEWYAGFYDQKTGNQEYAAAYDSMGKLREHTEIVTETGRDDDAVLNLQTVTHRKNIEYDNFNRQVSYEQRETDSSSPHLLKTMYFTAESYSGFGNLTGFDRTIKRQSIDFEGNEYKDDNGELILDKVDIQKRRNVAFNSLNQSVYYEEYLWSNTAKDLHQNIIWSGGAYNEAYQLVGFKKNTQNTGSIEQSLPSNWETLDLSERQKYLESIGSFIYNGETVVWAGLSGVKKEEIANRIKGRITLVINNENEIVQTDIRSNSYGQQIGYHQVSKDSIGQDFITVTDSYGTVYNKLNQVVDKTDRSSTVYSDGSYGITNTVTTKDMSYNEVGLDVSYDRTSRFEQKDVGLDYTTRLKRIDSIYNDLRQMVSYREESTDAYGRVNNVVWSEALYNSLGFNIYNEKTTVDEYGNTTKNLWGKDKNGNIASRYNGLGKLEGFAEYIYKEGMIKEDTYHERSLMGYNFNELLCGYTDMYEKTDAFGYVTKIDSNWTGEYNDRKQYKSTIEDSVTTFANNEKRHSVKKWSADMEDSYSAADQVMHTVEELKEENFNNLDELESSKLETREWYAGTNKDVKDGELPYNRYNSILSFKEVVHSESTTPDGVILLHDSDNTREGITYIDPGKEHAGKNYSYSEHGFSTTQGEYEKYWIVNSFNKWGQVKAYSEEGYNTSNGTYYKHQSDATYDDKGQILGYYVWGGGSSEDSYRKTVTDSLYDCKGRNIYYSEFGRSTAGDYDKQWYAGGNSFNINLSKPPIWVEGAFNGFDQLILSYETGSKAVDGGYEKTWQAKYDDYGKQLYTKEQKTNYYEDGMQEDDRITVIEWWADNNSTSGKSSYDNEKRWLEKYYQESRLYKVGNYDSADKDRGVEELLTTTFDATFSDSFDSKGQKTHNKQVENNSYYNRPKASDQIVSETTTKEWFAGNEYLYGSEDDNEYDELYRLESSYELISKEQIFGDDSIFKTEQTIRKTDNKYYTKEEETADYEHVLAGQMKAYVETVTNSNTPDKMEIREISDTVYNNQGLKAGEKQVKREQGIESYVPDKLDEVLTDFSSGISIDSLLRKLNIDLSGFDIISPDILTPSIIKSVVNWLKDSATESFNCAMNALYNMLNLLGFKVTKSDIFLRSIIIDTLIGNISLIPKPGDILNTSALALSKIAKSFGVDVAERKGVDLTQLASMINPGNPVIALVDEDGDSVGDHFYSILSITDSEVHYSDGTKTDIISREAFSDQWTGRIIGSKDYKELGEDITDEELATLLGSRLPSTKEFDYFDYSETMIFYSGIERDAMGRWTGWKEDITYSGSSDKNTVVEIRTDYQENSQRYDTYKAFYHEFSMSDQDKSEPKLNKYYYMEKQFTGYDQLNRATNWVQTTYDLDKENSGDIVQIGKVSKITTSDVLVTYNDKGFYRTYNENAREQDPTGLVYNKEYQLYKTGYINDNQLEGDDESGIRYDSYGRAYRWYQETTGDDALGKITKSNHYINYFINGMNSKTTETGIRKSISGDELYVSYEKTTSGKKYDDVGNLIEQYEEYNASDAPDKELETKVLSSYDDQARMSRITQDITEKDKSIFSLKLDHSYTVETDQTYYEYGLIKTFDKITVDGSRTVAENCTADILYDISGRQTYLKTQNNERDNTAGNRLNKSFSVETYIGFDGKDAYDELGNRAFTRRITREKDLTITEETLESNLYNREGLLAYSNTVKKEQELSELGVLEDKNGDGILLDHWTYAKTDNGYTDNNGVYHSGYNALGQLAFSKKETKDSSKVTVEETQYIVIDEVVGTRDYSDGRNRYDKLGRLVYSNNEYTETGVSGVEGSEKLNKKYFVETTIDSNDYNDLGQVLKQTRVTGDYYEGKVVKEVTEKSLENTR
ncbi:MAG: hypothetical protein ABII27_02870, partial [bacterium]